MLKKDAEKSSLSVIICIFVILLLLAIIIGILYYYTFTNKPFCEECNSYGTFSMSDSNILATNSVSGENTSVEKLVSAENIPVTSSSNSFTTKNLNQIYEDYVKNYISSSNTDLEIVHTSTDIDNDGTLELLIKSSTCEADSMLFIFTYKNGEILELGSIASAHSSFYEMNNENYIQKTCGHMGQEEISNIYISNDKIEETFISSREISMGEDYQKGDILLNI